MSEPIKPVYAGSTIKKVTLELDAEVTPKGQVFLLFPKTRFQVHRENVDRLMIQDMEVSHGTQ